MSDETQNFRRTTGQSTALTNISFLSKKDRDSFDAAAEAIQAMSARITLANRTIAIMAANQIEESIKEKIPLAMQSPHRWGMGRLKATFGHWDPSYIADWEAADMFDQTDMMSYERHQAQEKKMPSGAQVEARAIEWASAHGVEGYNADTYDNITEVENGAYWSVRKFKNGQWTAEVGTFTPYAALVNDGGQREIHPFGNPESTVLATWIAVNYMESGMAEAEPKIAAIVEREMGAATI